MNAAHARQRVDFLNEIDTQLPAFTRAIFRAGHSFDDVVRNVDTRYMGAHELRGLGRAQRAYADQNEHFAEQAEVCHFTQELLQQRNVVAVLCLYELSAGLDLLREPLRPPGNG